MATDISAQNEKQETLYFSCPWCGGGIMVSRAELNCRIFRHGVYKTQQLAGTQMNPHECEAECKRLFENGLIDGCGKPFRVDETDTAVICGYI